MSLAPDKRRDINIRNTFPRKLTEAQVSEIKARLREGAPRAALAVEYGVTALHIGAIARGEKWGWVK